MAGMRCCDALARAASRPTQPTGTPRQQRKGSWLHNGQAAWPVPVLPRSAGLRGAADNKGVQSADGLDTDLDASDEYVTSLSQAGNWSNGRLEDEAAGSDYCKDGRGTSPCSWKAGKICLPPPERPPGKEAADLKEQLLHCCSICDVD